MIKLFCFLALIAVATAASYSNCDRNAPVQLTLQSLPDPVRLVSGGLLPVKAVVNAKQVLPSKLKIIVKAEKKILWGYWTLPCYSNVGSCTYDLDCSVILKQCPDCQCPVPAGQHPVDKSLKIPSISIPSFLTNGDYRVSFDARVPGTNARIACGTLKVKVSS